MTREAIDVLQFDARHRKSFAACANGFKNAASKRTLRSCLLYLLLHLQKKRVPPPFWNFDPARPVTHLPLRYPHETYLRETFEHSVREQVADFSNVTMQSVDTRMLMAVGSRSGIACVDACVGVAQRIRANSRRPFVELWALLTGEGYCTSAFFLKFTHGLDEIGEKLRQFDVKDRWLADNSTLGRIAVQKLWCVYVDEIPGHAPKHTYRHKIADFIQSLRVFRLGLFHFLQRITASWKGTNPITLALAMQRLADCFTAINSQDVATIKAYNRSKAKPTPSTRAYLREHCRANQLPIPQQLAKADRVMAELAGTKDPVTRKVMVSQEDMQNYKFQRQLVEKGFLEEPLSANEMHVNVTKIDRRTGKPLMPRWYALGGEQKLEALWRELKDILQSIGTYGPTLAVELLMTARMVEHNQHTDNLLEQSVDLGTSDMSLVICILKLEEEIAKAGIEQTEKTFSHVKLNSFLHTACNMPKELIHPFGVQEMPSDENLNRLLKEEPIEHHVLNVGADGTATVTAMGQQLSNRQPMPITTSPTNIEGSHQPSAMSPLVSTVSAEQLQLLPPPSPQNTAPTFTAADVEIGRQAARKVPATSRLKHRSKPSLGEFSFAIETEAERRLAWELMQLREMKFVSGEPRHDKILAAFNAQVGVNPGIRPKEISDIKQYFTAFALTASATQFMQTAQSSIATPSNQNMPSAVASQVTGMGGSRSNRGESLRCKCGDFMANHIVHKFRQVGECLCPNKPEECTAKWVRDGYVCPKSKQLGGDGAEAVRLANACRVQQQAHRRARERLRKARAKRPKIASEQP